jgi:hypothetical protein
MFMMNDSQLNTLALQAKEGCKSSKEALLRWFIPKVTNISREIWYLINDECAFENDCYGRFDTAIKRFNPNQGNFSYLVYLSLRQCRNKYVTDPKRKSQRSKLSYLEELAPKDDSGAARVNEPEDVLADVEGSVLDKYSIKEKIALLAKGDPKKVTILKAWVNGYDNDSEIAQLLAQLYGGKSESHRQTIKRFRTSCKAALSATA